MHIEDLNSQLLAIKYKEERQKGEQEDKVKAEQIAKEEALAKEEARKPKIYEGVPAKGLEVDAEVIYSQKPNKVKIYIKGFEEKLFDMVDSAPQPKGFICRVSLIMDKGRILRVSFKMPK